MSNNKLNFNNYRKLTQTDTIILKNSNYKFIQNNFYFKSLLYKLEQITQNKFNYKT